MPPVIHVDTDAPLYSDRDGKLITDKMWGIYYKPDFHFGGVQGGAMPAVVDRPADEVRVDPYGPKSPEFVVTDNFADMWTSALAFCQKRFEGKHGVYRKEPSGGIGCFTPDSFPVIDPLSRERVRDRRLESRLQDDRGGRPRVRRVARREEPAARAVPLLALLGRQAAPGEQQPVSLELALHLPRPRALVGALYTWMIAVTVVVTVITWDHPVLRAVVAMGWGVIVVWITFCGGLMWRHRERLRAWVRRLARRPATQVLPRLPLPSRSVEEAVTTSMDEPRAGARRADRPRIRHGVDQLPRSHRARHSVVILLPMVRCMDVACIPLEVHSNEAFVLSA
jgi:hypothetical protein